MTVNGMREGPSPVPCSACGKEPEIIGVTWNGWTDTSCKCTPGVIGGGVGESESIRNWNTKQARAAVTKGSLKP